MKHNTFLIAVRATGAMSKWMSIEGLYNLVQVQRMLSEAMEITDPPKNYTGVLIGVRSNPNMPIELVSYREGFGEWQEVSHE